MPSNLCDVDVTPLNDLISGTLGEPEQGEFLGQATCRWTSDQGERATLMSSTMPKWMAVATKNGTPSDLLDEVRATGKFEDPAEASRIERAEAILASDQGPTAAEACEIHDLLLEIPPQDHPAFTTRTDLAEGTRSTYETTPNTMDMHMGQTCAHGRRYTLSISSDYLDNSEAEAAALLDAVAAIARSQ